MEFEKRRMEERERDGLCVAIHSFFGERESLPQSLTKLPGEPVCVVLCAVCSSDSPWAKNERQSSSLL